MKLLVIGANGQLGWEICRKGKDQGIDMSGLDLPDFDVTEPSKVKKAVHQAGVSLIVNASAYTAVDTAESEPEVAFAVNRDGSAYLAVSCAEAGIPLIHISTDYVFDGSKQDPYLETEPVSPLGIYGKSKAAGETEIRVTLKEHIIIRTAWLYGLHGTNFVKTMLRLGKEKEVLSVVADQYGCPTYAADLAEAILTIATQTSEQCDVIWGTYHYCGNGMTSWHGFAEEIFHIAKQYDSFMVKEVIPIATSQFPTAAKRPANSVMDSSQITKHFGVRVRPWQESLADMVHRYYQ